MANILASLVPTNHCAKRLNGEIFILLNKTEQFLICQKENKEYFCIDHLNDNELVEYIGEGYCKSTISFPDKLQKRNVIEKFSSWTNDDIIKELRKTSFSFAVLMEQLIGDYNIGTLIRNANAFNAKKVFYYGPRKKIDRRGSVGTYLYADIEHISSIDRVKELKNTYTLIGLDCIDGSVPMEDFSWPSNSLMIFGEEGNGISAEMLSMCDKIVAIKQYGSVKSLNVGTASGIAMYDYTSKLNGRK